MRVRFVHRKADGTTEVELVDYGTGKVMKSPPRQRTRAGQQGYWQLSISNAVPLHQVEKAKRIDAELGVSIDYVKKGHAALAAFNSPTEKRRWLRAHRRVDHDACYKDPCPGDFRKD